jgi:hypothetical protein
MHRCKSCNGEVDVDKSISKEHEANSARVLKQYEPLELLIRICVCFTLSVDCAGVRLLNCAPYLSLSHFLRIAVVCFLFCTFRMNEQLKKITDVLISLQGIVIGEDVFDPPATNRVSFNLLIHACNIRATSLCLVEHPEDGGTTGCCAQAAHGGQIDVRETEQIVIVSGIAMY